MKTLGRHAVQVQTKRPFDDAIRQVTELLSEEGFGILTEIDVAATMKKKLDVTFRPYRILGACNPPLAHRALEADPSIGALLPCNVVVSDEGDHRLVTAMEPRVMADVLDSPTVHEIAEEVSAKLHAVLERID